MSLSFGSATCHDPLPNFCLGQPWPFPHLPRPLYLPPQKHSSRSTIALKLAARPCLTIALNCQLDSSATCLLLPQEDSVSWIPQRKGHYPTLPPLFKHNSCGQMQARGLSQNVRRIYYYQNSTCCMVYSNPLLQMIVWTQGLPITTNPYIWQDRYCRYMQVQGQCIFNTRSTIVQVQLPSQNIAISISSQPIIVGLAMILDQEWET